MSSDKRRSPRKKINTVGFLYTTEGRPLGECRIKDIFLSFSRDGKVRRRCEVRWSKEKEIGVRFLS
jgi:hypothetical protein